MANLNKFLRDADERVRKAAADALNEAAKELKQEVLDNMVEQGIQNRTGGLWGSVEAQLATPEDAFAQIKSEVFKPAPKEPGKYNPAMRGRYEFGAPYGRLLEFGKFQKPFFYTAWYEMRNDIKDDVTGAIGDAWSNG